MVVLGVQEVGDGRPDGGGVPCAIDDLVGSQLVGLEVVEGAEKSIYGGWRGERGGRGVDGSTEGGGVE